MTEFRARVLYDFAAEGETELNIRQPRIIWIGFFAYFETKTEIIKVKFRRGYCIVYDKILQTHNIGS